MLNRVLQFLKVACSHKRTSQPFSAAVAKSNPKSDWDPVAPTGRHYVVCLDCGQKFDYDWKQMKIVG